MKFTPKNRDFEATIREKLQRQHLMHHLGFELTAIKPGWVEGKASMKEFLQQQNGFLHGGATATFCDLVAGFAAFTLVEAGASVVTVELKVSYFNPGVDDVIYATGEVIKTGNTLTFCEAEVFSMVNGEKHLIAKCTTTMAKVIL